MKPEQWTGRRVKYRGSKRRVKKAIYGTRRQPKDVPPWVVYGSFLNMPDVPDSTTRLEPL